MQVDYRRLVLALPVLGVAFLLLFVFVFENGAKREGLANAQLLDTPPAAADKPLKVGLESGDLAPNFEISQPDGTRVRLSDLRGRPVLVSFFALWCGSCLAEMPIIKDIHSERGLANFTVLAINTGESRRRALEFIDFIDAPFVWGLDFDLTVSDAYGVHGLPSSVFIDGAGVVRAVYAGQATRERLNVFLDAAFHSVDPGPAPFELRLVSSIPRDNILAVETRGENRLTLSSRRLRCDPSFCAGAVRSELAKLPGVVSVDYRTSSAQPSMEVQFRPDVVGPDDIILTVMRLLGTLPDPLFETPPLVKLVNS